MRNSPSRIGQSIQAAQALNAPDEAGSGRDRHEHLGHGFIDPEALVEVVRRADAPVVCETGDDGRKDDIAWLREQLA